MTSTKFTLEERLLGLEHTKDAIINQIKSPLIVPKLWNCPYLKHDLVRGIVSFLTNQKVTLRENPNTKLFSQFYNGFNWEQLKRMGYGILNVRGMDAEVFKRITDVEAGAYLAGFWWKRSTKDPRVKFDVSELETTPMKKTHAKIIKAGMQFLLHVKNGKERYKQMPRFPYASKINKRCNDVLEFQEPAPKVLTDELVDVVTYLRNCDRLPTRPNGNALYAFDLEREHPISF